MRYGRGFARLKLPLVDLCDWTVGRGYKPEVCDKLSYEAG
jgi:hypothetical protein